MTSQRVTEINVILATTKSGWYGVESYDGEKRLPWEKNAEDMEHFRYMTTRGELNAVIMGVNTWRSLNRKPLGGRLNIVVTTGVEEESDGYIAEVSQPGISTTQIAFASSFDIALEVCVCAKSDNIWAIGGARIWSEVFDSLHSMSRFNGKIKVGEIHHTVIDSGNIEQTRSVLKGGKAVYYTRIFEEVKNHDLYGSIQSLNIRNGVINVYMPDTQPLRYQVRRTVVFQEQSSVGFQNDIGANGSASTQPLSEPGIIDLATCFSHTSSNVFDEVKYLDLMRRVITEGEWRDDRTGVGTVSLFSPEEIRYDLRDGRIPIFTTKKVVWEKGLEELLWFISGDTSSKTLEAKGVNYWKGNSSRQFLDKRGLHDYEEGQLGPVYGWQMRRWGAKFPDKEGGVDQLKNLVDQIRADPFSRRHILNMWNVSDLDKMALCPCHMMCQFYVSVDPTTKVKYLDCKMYQRSADLFLGVPLNVFCYSLLTHMIAHLCGLKPRYFIHTFGDAHVYQNHIEQVNLQLSREVYDSPTIEFTRSGEEIGDIDGFVFRDVKINNYAFHPFIKADMAV